MNNELEKICKEAVVAQFEVVSRDFPVGTEENRENLRISRLSAEI
jgi:hypothetical protein